MMPRQSKTSPGAPELFDVKDVLKTAPCVLALRKAVGEWRDQGYPGVTETTRALLNFWFFTDHLSPFTRRPFAYHGSQREAIETLIYVYEVAKARTNKALLEQFARQGDLQLLTYDLFARYAIKMATGSGKTLVMALAIAWQYLNAVRENEEDYAKTFLIIAPNIIVLERLKTDFAEGRIFRNAPLMPESFRHLFWDMGYVMRGESERAATDGLLFLTNIQQFQERNAHQNGDEPEEMTAVLGGKPPAQGALAPDFAARIAARGGKLLVLNDEAHHTHEEESEWNKTIRALHTATPLVAQLDFSATPRHDRGNLFEWTISDYPLKQAILDNIVKRPMKGIAEIAEVKSDIASVKYEGFLVAGVERWREYHEQLAPLRKKPILFVMMNSKDEADDVADFLRRKYPDELAGDRTLVIHTDTKGEITKSELERARVAAREVDDPNSPINAIVSVLMLREGWDVQNVTVIVGLRPYSSKANILPEQTIGRGLRLMFRNQGLMGYTERVDIIGNRTFLAFIDDLERIEDIKLGTFEVGKEKLQILTIQPEEAKAAFDIGLPELSPMLQRRQQIGRLIEAIDVLRLQCPVLPRKPGDSASKTFHYEGRDILTLEKLLEREYTIPEPRTPEEIIGYYARLIASDLKLTAQFSVLAPKVRDFFARKAFGETVDLTNPAILSAMNSNVSQYVVKKVFTQVLREQIIEEVEPQLVTPARLLSRTQPFPYSRPIYEAKKCVLNFVPCDNEFERAFAKFLDRAGDVVAFCKLPDSFGFVIPYTDTSANLRNYRPDFVVVLSNGEHWIVETKGQENIDVARKDAAATLWCEHATELTGTTWKYLKVPQKHYEQLQPADFAELQALGLWTTEQAE
jgi:type III restriction enzyme